MHRTVTCLRLLRAGHWIKNGVLLLPAFFAGQLFGLERPQLTALCISVAAFCLLSSVIYIINDITDLKQDRLHPDKRKRPLAAGEVTIRQSLVLAMLLTAAFATLLVLLPLPVAITLLSYAALNLLYCFVLKNMAIIDVTCISIGFVLRMVTGGLAAGIALTHWIIILTFLLMFSIALAKRRSDLVMSNAGTQVFRKSQSGYSLQFIDIATGISFAVTIVAYLLYSVSEDVMQRMASRHIYVTSLPVFLGMLRYLQLSIVEQRTTSPVRLLFSDVFLIVVIVAWLLLFYFILYA